MEYNKFIYKINKYKFYLRGDNRYRKDHYQKKINFYYNKLDQLIKKKGGAFTNDDLQNFIQPTIDDINQKINKTSNIEIFQNQEQTYIKNHEEILKLLKDLETEKTKLTKNNSDYDNKIKELEQQIKKIKQKIEERKKLTYDKLSDKYKL
jgi:hypothetical protein